MGLTTVENEYLTRAREDALLEPVEIGSELPMMSISVRERLVREYAWAIPDEAALEALARYGPLVEIGAGGGYWAHLLRERGVDIVAYEPELWFLDQKTNERAKPRVWADVLLGDHTAVERHPDRTLFLCWPSHAESWAAEALEIYRGEHVAYVGEWKGCTADLAFHENLVDHWERVERVKIPRYYLVDDELTIWKRRG